MSSNDIDIHHLGAAYALDALDERERTAFEAHYPSCEVCRSDVLAFRATLTQVAAAQAAAPPPALKGRVMAEIAQTRQLSPLLPDRVTDLAERRRRRQRTMGGALAAAAAVVLVLSGALLLRGDDAPASADALVEVLRRPDARVLTLEATAGAGGSGGEAISGAVVTVAWSSTAATAVLVAAGLPEAPDGSVYELWLIADDVPQPMRVLEAAADGELQVAVDIDDVPDLWGITIEPVGGSDSPTGEILFLGTV